MKTNITLTDEGELLTSIVEFIKSLSFEYAGFDEGVAETPVYYEYCEDSLLITLTGTAYFYDYTEKYAVHTLEIESCFGDEIIHPTINGLDSESFIKEIERKINL
jgi:hypothetical protein